jgi:protein-tyrosine kinase
MQIPPQSMEIEKIYSQHQRESSRSIAVCSANRGEGVTSVALALAQRNLLAGHSTLVVDLNLYRPALNTLLILDEPALETGVLDKPRIVTVKQQPIALIGITSPSHRDLVMKLRKPGVLEELIIEWKKSFDIIIFDTSPINCVNANNIPAERIAEACDGCLLVVLAGNTTESMVSVAVEKLKCTNAILLGCVLNDRDNPSLKRELLRETRRLESICSGLAKRIGNWIRNSHLLSMEI